MTSSSKEPQPNPSAVSQEEMNGLKRDMRSAHLAAWVQGNQQKIIAAIVALLLVIVGASLWRQHITTQRVSAATLYHQALNSSDAEAKRALLEKVVKDYASTAYGGMAQLLLAKVDQEHADQHLEALLSSSAVDQGMRWQAQLDLARVWLHKGDKAQARKILGKSVGKDYEQLRHYLMAEASGKDADRIAHLEQALNSISHDTELKKHIEKRLAELKSSPGTGVSSR
ncbi:MAG: tetratricopeptide repeat protein [Mariprofundaceae bacterium]|nr:tetratricopeptide repeat protein [Mariprofundaceae bacterium]